MPALVLVDPSGYHVEVSVDEVDVARIGVGQRTSISLDALPDQLLGGAVERIAPTGKTDSGVVSYRVRILLDAVGKAVPLRAGMTATADIVVQEIQDAVLVPNWAVRRDRETGKAYVQLKQGERVSEVEIKLGLRTEEVSQVLSGLAPGDTVVADTARRRFSLFGFGQ